MNKKVEEIAYNSSLGGMNDTLSTAQITNKDGKTVDALAKIDTFTMEFVSAIKLSGSGLYLSNIHDGKAYDVDMSNLDEFLNTYKDYESDTIYSGVNGTYNSKGKISHTLTFDYMGLKDSTALEYYSGDVVSLPYNVGDIIDINSSLYEVEGYYTDASYQNKIIDSYYMPEHNKKIYIKLK